MLIHWPCCFKSSFWKLSVGWMDKGLIEEKLLSNFSFLHHCHFLSSLILCYLEICRKSRKNWRSTKLKKTSGLKHISLNITNPQKRNGSTEQGGFQTIGWILKVWCKNLDTNWYQMGLSICLIIMDPIELCQKLILVSLFFYIDDVDLCLLFIFLTPHMVSLNLGVWVRCLFSHVFILSYIYHVAKAGKLK